MDQFITDERIGLRYDLIGDYYLIAGEDEPEGQEPNWRMGPTAFAASQEESSCAILSSDQQEVKRILLVCVAPVNALCTRRGVSIINRDSSIAAVESPGLPHFVNTACVLTYIFEGSCIFGKNRFQQPAHILCRIARRVFRLFYVFMVFINSLERGISPISVIPAEQNAHRQFARRIVAAMIVDGSLNVGFGKRNFRFRDFCGYFPDSLARVFYHLPHHASDLIILSLMNIFYSLKKVYL